MPRCSYNFCKQFTFIVLQWAAIGDCRHRNLGMVFAKHYLNYLLHLAYNYLRG